MVVDSVISVDITPAKPRMVGRPFVSRGISLGAVRASANIILAKLWKGDVGRDCAKVTCCDLSRFRNRHGSDSANL